MLENFEQAFLPAGQTVVDDDRKLSTAARIFFLALFNRSGKGTGVPREVETGVAAAGTMPSTATMLNVDINQVDAVAANAGVALLSSLRIGQLQIVFNNGANTLKIYPPSGMAIDALGVNNPYSLSASKMQIFLVFSTTQIRSFGRLQIP